MTLSSRWYTYIMNKLSHELNGVRNDRVLRQGLQRKNKKTRTKTLVSNTPDLSDTLQVLEVLCGLHQVQHVVGTFHEAVEDVKGGSVPGRPWRVTPHVWIFLYCIRVVQTEHPWEIQLVELRTNIGTLYFQSRAQCGTCLQDTFKGRSFCLQS